MPYENDVFLSYLTEKPCGTWVHEHFLPYFRHQLGNALNRRAEIFVDREGIHSGQNWPNRLKQALATSRCLVGIWSPLYFQSEWCRNECAIMRHREMKLGLGTTARPDGLLVGVRVNDGIYFPEYARDTHRADFEQFFVDGPGFSRSELHVDFQLAVPSFAEDVARVVRLAPDWSPEWLTPPWTDEIIAHLTPPPTPEANQPILA
jgi:hypothetical protein